MNKKRIHNTAFVLDCGTKYMIDCPWAPAYVFEQVGLNLDDVERVIITHAHYDHVGGLEVFLNFKDANGKKVRLYTTKAIYEGVKQAIEPSLSGRIGSMFRLYEKKFDDFVEFVELEPRKVYKEDGVSIVVRENVHSIPAIGLKISDGEKTFAYSGDTKYDPELLKKLHEQGIINDEQLEDGLNFLWDADFIVHEAAEGEMFHTDIAHLEELPEKVRKKVYIAHRRDELRTSLKMLEDFERYKI